MPRPTTLLPLLAAMLVAAGTVPAAAQIPVTIQFQESAGRPVAVRAGVFYRSIPILPVDPAGHVFQNRGSDSWFYCDGEVLVYVPAGSVTIRAGRGFEYQACDTTLTITGPTRVVVTLSRFIDMSSLGYYSGDTHVHLSHPPVIYTLGATHLRLAADAEDLNFVNSMEEQAYFTGAPDPLSDAQRVIVFSKEQRNAHMSHLSVLGLKEWIYDQGCEGELFACGATLDASIHAQVHAQPGETAVIATHPFSTLDMTDVSRWPGGGMWRAMAIDLPAGAVDAMDLLTYTTALPPVGAEPYFQALNAGFRLAPAAGTDCTLGSGKSGPAGGYRVYVQTDGPLSPDAWIAGVKAGRSFVSNYPLIPHFEIGGAHPGGVVNTDAGELRGSVLVTCALPLQKVEIIGNTGLLEVIHAPGGSARTISGWFTVPRAGLSWVVARATGSALGWHVVSVHGLFAQTAPVYITPAANTDPDAFTPSPSRRTAAEYFLERLDELEAVFDAEGYFPAESRIAFDDAAVAARQYYLELLTVPTGVNSPARSPEWVLGAAHPNPSADEVRFSYAVPVGKGGHSIAIYDARGRMVRLLFHGARAGGDYELIWDGRDDRGVAAASGVYFARISPREGAAVSRKFVLIR